MARRDYRDSEGNRLPGVTTVIGSNLGWSKNALMYWAWKEGMEGRDYKDTSSRAADIGTIAHAMVEADLKQVADWRQLVDMRGVTQEQVDQAENAYLAWLQWRQGVNFELTASEHALVSETYGYGGTIDVAAVRNELALVDIKTSKDIYADHKIQLAAYAQLWNETYPDSPVRAAYLIRLGKDGSFSDHYLPDLSKAWEAFVLLLQLHRLKREV